MWCIDLAPDAWNLSWRCQATHDAQDAGDTTQDTQDAKAPYLMKGNFLLMLYGRVELFMPGILR